MYAHKLWSAVSARYQSIFFSASKQTFRLRDFIPEKHWKKKKKSPNTQVCLTTGTRPASTRSSWINSRQTPAPGHWSMPSAQWAFSSVGPTKPFSKTLAGLECMICFYYYTLQIFFFTLHRRAQRRTIFFRTRFNTAGDDFFITLSELCIRCQKVVAFRSEVVYI